MTYNSFAFEQHLLIYWCAGCVYIYAYQSGVTSIIFKWWYIEHQKDLHPVEDFLNTNASPLTLVHWLFSGAFDF